MKHLNKIISLALIVFFIGMTSCSSDDDSVSDDMGSDQTAHAGEPHSYNFTITGGPLEGNYSGEIENDLVITELMLANYSAYMEINPNGRKDISLHIFDEDLIISGAFFYKNGNTENFGEEQTVDFSNMSFQFEPSAIRYNSIAGTVELSEVDFTNSVGINQTYNGLAAYKVTFDGTFMDIMEGDEVHISGTVKVNFPDNVNEL